MHFVFFWGKKFSERFQTKPGGYDPIFREKFRSDVEIELSHSLTELRLLLYELHQFNERHERLSKSNKSDHKLPKMITSNQMQIRGVFLRVLIMQHTSY